MKRKWKIWCTPFIGAILVLTACTSQQGMNEKEVGTANLDFHDKSVNKKGNGNVHGDNDSVNVIPSIDRAKKKTTNQHKQTTGGIGTNVYSLIGSSSLHDGGISSHLESRLAGEGIPGIKVFVLDDTVILARAQPETTSTRYDEMQRKVLSNTSGASGKGDLDGVDETKVNTDDNLDKAKDLVGKAFNGQVQILTITDPKALPLIDGIKANIKSATPTYSKLSSDINTLVKMTLEK
jgi:archaellum component FlaC